VPLVELDVTVASPIIRCRSPLYVMVPFWFAVAGQKKVSVIR